MLSASPKPLPNRNDAATRVDLTAHAKNFPQITAPGAEIRGVRRMYAWLDEQRAAK